MKKIFLLLFISTLFLIGCKEQEAAQEDTISTAVVTTSVLRNATQQTITTSSSLDTVTFDLGNFSRPYNYQIQLNADSLSGATGATCYLELSLDGGGSDWTRIETLTINGVSTRLLDSGSFERGQLRCICYAPSSTQSTAVRVDFAASNQ